MSKDGCLLPHSQTIPIFPKFWGLATLTKLNTELCICHAKFSFHFEEKQINETLTSLSRRKHQIHYELGMYQKFRSDKVCYELGMYQKFRSDKVCYELMN